MTTDQLRKKFLDFFAAREHAILDSASLITKDDKGVTNSTLFNTAGVQPLVPYLLGQEHPQGKRLASAQKCVRTIDIDDVGDDTHLTFFEMLGNWSLGDYFKEEAIKWSYEFLTTEEGLGLDPEKIYITVFEGDENAPRDDEAFQIWKKYVPENRIYFMSAGSNWWSAGDNGPCGPDTEMFYDISETSLGDLNKDEFIEAEKKQSVVEIWNDVFMQFEKKDGKIIGSLPHKAVDTGAGLERLTTVVNKYQNVYQIDTFVELLNFIKQNSDDFNEREARIIADHVKASVMLIADGVLPSNTDRGYILRRLLRRAIKNADQIKLVENKIENLSQLVIDKMVIAYPYLENKREQIRNVISEEEVRFRKTLNSGLRQFEKIIQILSTENSNKISGVDAFKLFSSYGFPIELTIELAKEKGLEIDLETYNTELKKHQDLSRTSTEGKFKGGLESRGDTEIKYHTATHLLQAALKKILGDHVAQKGSNINEKRLRFDFSHTEKMTDDQKEQVENLVNEKIQEKLPVTRTEMNYADAKNSGAIGVFEDKYGDTVSVYTIGDPNNPDNFFSKELCGGPHVKNTGTLGKFKIKKEESVSAGVRRIKATLE